MKFILKNMWPNICICCAQRSDHSYDLCSDCEQSLPWLDLTCQQCGVALKSNELICGQCLQQPPYFDRTLALFHYQAPISHWITQLKFKRQLIYARLLGQLMAKALKLPLPDLLIPVPLHPKRLKQRGFNQALEIAKSLSKQTQIPIARFNCRRRKHTQAQTELNWQQRQTNLKNAFSIKKPLTANAVAIVDDVMTTGATVNALAKQLKQQGVEHVQVLVPARTELPH